MIEVSEDCDDANADDTDACIDCTLARCGDGIIQTGVETCDDSNLDPHDDCTATCQVAICGDGVIKEGEVCDDGNSVDDDWCANDCTANDRQEWFDEIADIGGSGYGTEARAIVAIGEQTWVTGPYSDSGPLEFFVIGYDADGNRIEQWRHVLLEGVSTEPNAIMVADDGDLVVVGEASIGVSTHAFVAKFGLDGTLRWSDMYEAPSNRVLARDAIPTGNGSFAVGGQRHEATPGWAAWVREYANDGTVLEDWDYQVFDAENRVDALAPDGEGGYVMVRTRNEPQFGVNAVFRLDGDGTQRWYDAGWNNQGGYYTHYFGDVLRAPDGTFFSGGHLTRSASDLEWPGSAGYVGHYTATGATIGVTHFTVPQEEHIRCTSMGWKGSGGGFYCAGLSLRDDLGWDNVVELIEFDQDGAVVTRVPIDISPFDEWLHGLAVTPSDRLVIAVDDGTGSNGAWVGSYAG